MALYQQIFFTTLALAFGILHLMLYLYNRQFKATLYFSLFLFLYAVSIFFDFQNMIAGPNGHGDLFMKIHHAAMPFRSIFGLLFLYTIFKLRPPRQFLIVSAGLLITGLFASMDLNNFSFLLVFMFLYMVEACRILIRAAYYKYEGAWIIVSGFLLLFILSLYDMFLDFGFLQPFLNIKNGYQFGFGFLIISTSVYLAHDFAKMNRILLEQQRQAQEDKFRQRLLEEDDARKSKELEDAKNLQLAMLPKCLTEINNLDICFDMKPATEVGGDYYDYQIAEDGSLIITIGDATGHGIKAGIMVSIVKSLFVSHAPAMDFTGFFNLCSRTIRKMNLGNLYMTLLLAKIKDGKLTVSSAGMPPVFIYRAGSGVIEEILTKGAPLGAVDSFAYQTLETGLEHGDTLLLMSDGLSELFNEKDEMFDYQRIKNLFQETAKKPSHQVVSHLFTAAETWRKTRKQNDDMTFMVLKFK